MTATKAKRKATEKPAADPAPWAPRGDRERVPVNDFDPAPARAVRAGAEADPAYVEVLVAAYESDHPPPPPQAFRYDDAKGRPRYFLADGSNRLMAHRAAGVDRVECRVVRCESREDAEREAYRFAFRANLGHGTRRANADLQAAARAAIARPENAGLSDRKLDRLLGLGDGANYTSKLRKRLAAEAEAAAVTEGVGDAGDTSTTPHAAGKAPPADEVGRPVPDHLRRAFAGRAGVRYLVKLFRTAMSEAAEFAASDPGGAALLPVLDVVGLDLAARVIAPVAAAAPFAVCPAPGEAHPPGCRCSGRGWLTRPEHAADGGAASEASSSVSSAENATGARPDVAGEGAGEVRS